LVTETKTITRVPFEPQLLRPHSQPSGSSITVILLNVIDMS